jgi:hypothetical protein
MTNWIHEALYPGKPNLNWIDAYMRDDGTLVNGHYRSDANGIKADNLSSDVDNDGIAGFFDADADGDGIVDVLNSNGEDFTDAADIDGWIESLWESFF